MYCGRQPRQDHPLYSDIELAGNSESYGFSCLRHMAGTRQFNCQCKKYLFTVFLDPGNTLISVVPCGPLCISLPVWFMYSAVFASVPNWTIDLPLPIFWTALTSRMLSIRFTINSTFNVEGRPKNYIFKKAGRKNLIVTEICSDDYTAFT